MKKIYFVLLCFLFAQTFSQSFPYLNASTCNRGQMVVDKDTNLLIFHGNQLAKTDKNLNTIWAKNYSGVFLTNLLLSKTGSIFFLGAKDSVSPTTIFGKLHANGNLIWLRPLHNFTAVVSGTTTTGNWTCSRMMLDNNNELVIAGVVNSFSTCNSFMIKSDTIGNLTKLKCFNSTYFENFDILTDSAGFYKFIAKGIILGGSVMGMYTYSDISDNFTGSKYSFIGPYNFSSNFFKSKINGSFYVAGMSINSFNVCHLLKFNSNSFKWGTNIMSPALTNIFYNGIEEDEKGNILYNVSCGPACSSYTSGYVKVDSNGVGANNFTTMLKSYNVGPFPPKTPSHITRAIHENNYFFDVWGYSFPTNPLTIQKFNSSLTYSCSSSVAITRTATPGSYAPLTNPVIYNVSTYTFAAYNSSVTVSTFSVNPNFCLVMGQREMESDLPSVVLFPNPAKNNLKINLNPDYSIHEIIVFDVNGKNIGTYYNSSSIDVTNFPVGIYFIRIKTDKGEFNKKFIKN